MTTTMNTGEPDFMAYIEALGREDIQDMLTDQALLDAYFNSLEPVRQLQNAHLSRIERDIGLAEQNNARRPGLDELRAQTMASFQNAKQLQDRWSSVEKDQADAYTRFELPALLRRLRATTTESDHDSENLARAFRNGEMDEDEFVKQYLPLRRVYYRRALQLQKAGDGGRGLSS